MCRRGVPLMLCQTILRIEGVVFRHDAVSRYLGDDASCGYAVDDGVALPSHCKHVFHVTATRQFLWMECSLTLMTKAVSTGISAGTRLPSTSAIHCSSMLQPASPPFPCRSCILRNTPSVASRIAFSEACRILISSISSCSIRITSYMTPGVLINLSNVSTRDCSVVAFESMIPSISTTPSITHAAATTGPANGP
jgi:hypothetical protein